MTNFEIFTPTSDFSKFMWQIDTNLCPGNFLIDLKTERASAGSSNREVYMTWDENRTFHKGGCQDSMINERHVSFGMTAACKFKGHVSSSK